MKKEEFELQLGKIKREQNEKIEELSKKFALSNSSVKVGDFVKDHMGWIKVEKIGFVVSETNPYCTYFGAEYTLKMIQKKNKAKRKLYQINLREIKPC